MMNTNNLDQLMTAIYFILVGIILGIIFDIFRILRKTIKTSDIITNIEDIIYGIITGIIILISIYWFNNGELRLYIFLNICFGIITYMLLISKHFININIIFIDALKKCIKYVIKPFIILLKYLKKIIFRPISFIFINIKGFICKIFINQLKSYKKAKKLAK